MRYVAVKIASPHRYLGTFFEKVMPSPLPKDVYFSSKLSHFVEEYAYRSFDAQSLFQEKKFPKFY